MKDIVDKYIQSLEPEFYNNRKIYDHLENTLKLENETDKYVLNLLIDDHLKNYFKNEEIYDKRRRQLKVLKNLELPEQRSEEWYKLRRTVVTASTLGSAIDKSYFQSRDELLYSKIEETPYESNPITEWGVKYEDVAIMFYEELYNVKVLEFGLIPHSEFKVFGASPDGICEDTGNKDYIGRMVEIKCPPKRKFTKTVPHHYWLQVQGQIEVCNLDECDFFQVKLEEYENYEEYCKERFIIDDKEMNGRTILNYPKGATITYKIDDKLSYKYCKLNMSNQELIDWIESSPKENLFEVKWWKITRFECTLVERSKEWWIESIDKILHFYNDLQHYKVPENLKLLKDRIDFSKKRKKRIDLVPLGDFQLCSDDEDN
jgi:putative phage-type endonuclease